MHISCLSWTAIPPAGNGWHRKHQGGQEGAGNPWKAPLFLAVPQFPLLRKVLLIFPEQTESSVSIRTTNAGNPPALHPRGKINPHSDPSLELETREARNDNSCCLSLFLDLINVSWGAHAGPCPQKTVCSQGLLGKCPCSLRPVQSMPWSSCSWIWGS